LSEQLGLIVKERGIDCVIANAENAAGGSGITPQIYEKLLRYGVNLVTLGDHTYRKKAIVDVLETADNIVRPANISDSAAGRGWAIYQTGKGPVVGVISLIGRIFMKPAECPYNYADKLVGQLKGKCDIIFVDMHAEATSEKVAMGHYLDGRVGCVFGTHTHIATADEKILAGGTAYITDVGMTGPCDSVLGRKKESVIKSFRTQMPVPFEIARGDVQVNGIVVTVDSNTGRADSIERICVKSDAEDTVTYDSDDGKPEYANGF
jgi:metallophosphoesterase (TIGR00282 family)